MPISHLKQFFLTLLILPGLLFTPTQVSPAAAAAPVWGSKPVLGYFLLTAGLAQTLQEEVGLSDSQMIALQEIARSESVQLGALKQSSLAVTENLQLSLAEKRTQVSTSGYNQQVADIMNSSQQALDRVLNESETTRLVNWINQRWPVERQLHQSQQSSATARTYKIYATRYDSNGSGTVAIPDKCVKLANGGSLACDGYAFGQNYSVRIQYENNPAVKVTVGESGPWNVDDNFWATVGDPQPRREFTDLPLGMPEAQAAYFDNYNGGLDQFGRKVTSPFAIDLSEKVSQDLGMGETINAWVDVTFLWTEGWESQEVTQVTLNEPSKLQPAYSGDMCGSAWHKITGFSGGPAYLTLNTTSGQSTNSGEWFPNLPAAGDYKVEAFIPDHPPVQWQCPNLEIPRDTSDARYTVIHAKGQTDVARDQRPLANQWLDLGTYTFNAGTDGGVKLADANGETPYSRSISFSAVRFILQNETSPGPEPTPPSDAPPEVPPPPPPDPALWSGFLNADTGVAVTLPVQILNLPEAGLGTAVVDVQYDPAMLTAGSCQANPAGSFDSGTCTLEYEHDGINPDGIRVSLSSAGGVKGTAAPLAAITFQVSGSPGQAAPLKILPASFSDPAGTPLTIRASTGLICVGACKNLAYFPIVP